MPIFNSQAPPKKEALKITGFILIFICIVSFIIILIGQGLGFKGIGWHAGNFENMAINGYLITIIGFVFGGKVAQTYYENKFGITGDTLPPASEQNKTLPTGDLVNTGMADLAKKAVEQNKDWLRTEFPNISSISDTVDNLNGIDTHVVAIYLKDDKVANIPTELKVNLDDNSEKTVATEVIKNVGTPGIQQLQDQQITATNTTEKGSIGCMIGSLDDSNFRGVITSGHIYSNGDSTSVGDILDDDLQAVVSINNTPAGNWYFQLISNKQDIAIVKLNDGYQPAPYISFKDSGYYSVGDNDINKTMVTLVSNIRGTRTGFILDYNFVQDIPYNDNVTVTMDNIILVGSINNRQDSHPVSEEGDSGGCVYVTIGAENKLVGLILGRDLKYTYVLPVNETLSAWNFKPL